MFDDDKSGSIDAGELQKVMQKLGQTVDYAEAKSLIDEVDQDGKLPTEACTQWWIRVIIDVGTVFSLDGTHYVPMRQHDQSV